MPADAAIGSDINSGRDPVAAGGAAGRLPPWMATVAMLLPTYAWLTLAVLLPLGAMLVFSFLSGTPMGKKEVFFTLKNYRAFIDQPISSASPGLRS